LYGNGNKFGDEYEGFMTQNVIATYLHGPLLSKNPELTDYIIKKVGRGRGKVEIYDTTNIYGGMNSCSILEPFVKLYELTGEQRYLDFSEYIISTGFSKDQDIISLCKTKEKFPF